MKKVFFVAIIIIICCVPKNSICQNKHNYGRFQKALDFIHQKQYDSALMLLKKNISENPNASDIDYDYGWGIICLAKLCHFDELVEYYKILRMQFYGPSRSGGAIRNWDNKLKEARQIIRHCTDKNIDLILKELDQIDKEGKQAYERKLEELIKLGSMGNPQALDNLKHQGAALAELIAEGKLVLNSQDIINDVSFCQDNVSIPTIKKIGPIACILLPLGMQNSIKIFDPEFKVWTLQDYDPSLISVYSYSGKNLPFAVVGDFNGDLIQDVVLHGHNKSSDMIICILSEKNNYRIIKISQNEVRDWKYSSHYFVYLSHINPGLKESGFEEKPLELKNDAFELGYFEKYSTLYYYMDDKFFEYTTSD